MPTVLRVRGYRFFFVSHDRPEPPHVHVERGDASAKFWLERCQLARNQGFHMHELADVIRLLRERRNECRRRGMTSLEMHEAADIRVRSVMVTDEELVVGLMDGRTISAPLWWYPRLARATREQRAHWRLSGGGVGIHWPDVDEDLDTEGLLAGAPAPGVRRPVSQPDA